MSLRLVLIIIVFSGVLWAFFHGSPVVIPTAEPPVAAVDHPVAVCPDCVGPSVDTQPQPVYPMDMHQTYVPTTKPVPYHETQPGPPFSPKFGEPKK